MSTPKWNWKIPLLVISVRMVGGPANVVRGSPKFARTACARANGLTGQLYPVGDAEAARCGATPSTIAARNRAVQRRALRRVICEVVAMAPPSKGAQIAPSQR